MFNVFIFGLLFLILNVLINLKIVDLSVKNVVIIEKKVIILSIIVFFELL